jgi:hypothetical protein
MSNTEPDGRDPLSSESLPSEFEVVGFDDDLLDDEDDEEEDEEYDEPRDV